jgi:hypothetical protein
VIFRGDLQTVHSVSAINEALTAILYGVIVGPNLNFRVFLIFQPVEQDFERALNDESIVIE